MENGHDQYMKLYKEYRLSGLGKRESAELARYVLPSAISTRMVCTISLAALIHLNHVRVQGDTGRPQGETQEVSAEMVRLAIEAEPWLKPAFEKKKKVKEEAKTT